MVFENRGSNVCARFGEHLEEAKASSDNCQGSLWRAPIAQRNRANGLEPAKARFSPLTNIAWAGSRVGARQSEFDGKRASSTRGFISRMVHFNNVGVEISWVKGGPGKPGGGPPPGHSGAPWTLRKVLRTTTPRAFCHQTRSGGLQHWSPPKRGLPPQSEARFGALQSVG